MSSFTDRLELEFLGSRTYGILKEFTYHIGDEDAHELVRVPVGFITDFASIPRVLWPILPPDGEYGKAAVIHDALYRTKGMFGRYDRKRCDEILLEAMEVLDVQLLKRHVIYRGVRIGGWWEWRKPMDKKVERIFQDTKLTKKEILTAPKPMVK